MPDHCRCRPGRADVPRRSRTGAQRPGWASPHRWSRSRDPCGSTRGDDAKETNAANRTPRRRQSPGQPQPWRAPRDQRAPRKFRAQRQPSAPSQFIAALDAARRTLSDFESKRADAVLRVDALKEQRKRLAFDANTGDEAAGALALNRPKLTSESATIDLTIENLGAGIAEAKRRVGAAEAQLARAEKRARAEEARPHGEDSRHRRSSRRRRQVHSGKPWRRLTRHLALCGQCDAFAMPSQHRSSMP